jgi:hypothetical protein
VPSRTTGPDSGLRRQRGAFAALGLAAIGAFVFGLLVLHAASAQDQPTHMSEFANSRFGLLWALSLYTFILGGAMVVWARKPRLKDCPSKMAGLGMLWFAAIGAFLLATFPTDEAQPLTWVGQLHIDATITTFTLLGAAMVVLAPAFRGSNGLVGLAPISAGLGVLVIVSWVTYLVTTLRGIEGHAAAQRVLVGLVVAWFLLVGIGLRRAEARARAAAVPLATFEGLVAARPRRRQARRRRAAPTPQVRARRVRGKAGKAEGGDAIVDLGALYRAPGARTAASRPQRA